MTIVKGWCPDAYRPMAAGDGLLVRIRPRLARLTAEQGLGVCAAAIEHGNGLFDITRRANLQLRGVTPASWPTLLDRLLALGLIDSDPAAESRRAILVTPDWQPGDDSMTIAQALADRLDELPYLPPKSGFVIDAGIAPCLIAEPGDFRIERGCHGGLILRADGRAAGVTVAAADAADALIALAHWFAASGGSVAGRMARHGAQLPQWARGSAFAAPPGPPTRPGIHHLGATYGIPFGQIEASRLAPLFAASTAIRITPWRLLIAENVAAVPIDGLIIDPADPLLRVDACPGTPLCPQATVETRDLARRLAGRTPGSLHVSGCAKGCARSQTAAAVLTGRDGSFDLALDAGAGTIPIRPQLSLADVLQHFGAA